MYTGVSELYRNQLLYCDFLVQYHDCKWYQFLRKRMFREQMDSILPFVIAEVKALYRNSYSNN